jgi:hypothetical protein
VEAIARTTRSREKACFETPERRTEEKDILRKEIQ